MMPENETRRTPGAEELRNLVERQEREELREDLACALQHELREPLRRLIRQSLEEVIQQALEGEQARQVLERHVTDRILSGVAAELRDAQRELLAEARDDLAKAWKKEATEILLGSLREETTELVRQGIREGVQDVRFKRALIRSLRETHGDERRPESLPPAPVEEPHPPTLSIPEPRPLLPERRRPPSFASFLGALRGRPRAWVGGGAILILFGLSVPVWILASSSRAASPDRAGQPRPMVGTTLPIDPLQETWMERMTERKAASYPPMTEAALERYSFEEQFECWFNSSTRSRLDDLLRPSTPGDLHRDLWDAYSGCIREHYGSPPGSALPVLGAQAIVLDLLRRHASTDWQDCRQRLDLRDFGDLDDFPIDGQSGRRTEELLNGYLESCTGVFSLRINRESATPEYLFVLYAALKDLEEQGSP